MADEQPPKIIVDSDWKAQARAEKERLAAAEAAKKQEDQKRGAGPAGAGSGADRPGGGRAGATGGGAAQQMPPADFQSLMGTLITQALMYLGAFPDPETGRAIVSLEYARFHIDLLEVLQQKTKGNLTPDEDKEITQALSELRMRFVEISRAVVTAMQKRGAAGSGAEGGVPGAPGPDLRLST